MRTQAVVLITGCSMGGLGAALSEEFARRGCRVYASARKVSKMDGLSSSIERLALDVLSDTSVNDAVRLVIEKEGRIDVLVNNAGNSRIGAILEIPLEEIEQSFQVNTIAAVRVVKAVAPHMASRKSGLVIFTGSIAGNLATPWYGPYSAAKAGLHSLAETLDMELRPLGVRVLLLALGTVRSTIGASSAALHDFAPAPAFYDAFRANINARVGPQGAGAMPADEYARRVADAAFAPSPPQYLSFGGFALIVWLLSWIPRRPRLSLIRKMYSDKT